MLAGRHEARTALGREFGATDVGAERGAEGIARIREVTGGVDKVIDAAGTRPALGAALSAVLDGGTISRLGVSQYEQGPIGPAEFMRNITLAQAPAPPAPTSANCWPPSGRHHHPRPGLPGFVQPLKDSFEAIATLFFSSRSVRTWKRSSAPVAGDGLGQLLLVGGLNELVDQLRRQDVLDPEASHRGFGAEGDQQVGFAGSGVADEAERQALLDPCTLGGGRSQSFSFRGWAGPADAVAAAGRSGRPREAAACRAAGEPSGVRPET